MEVPKYFEPARQELRPLIDLPRDVLRTACASLVLAACATDNHTRVITPESKVTPARETATTIAPPKQVTPQTPLPQLECLEPFSDRPEWSSLWEAFPKGRTALDMFNQVGGKVPVNGNLPPDLGRWENACVIRILWALHQLGIITPKVSGKTVSGAKGEQYLFRVRDLKQYIHEIWGPSDIELTGGRNFQQEAGKHPALVIMIYGEPDGSASGHTTLYDGSKTVDGSGIGGAYIYVWRLGCKT